jgi:hypothetical protein
MKIGILATGVVGEITRPTLARINFHISRP